MKIFVYGLFMDQSLLATKGIEPSEVNLGFVDGTQVEATCYNLPGDKVTGANKEYAESLLDVATRLGFPNAYLDQIRQART